MTVTTLSLRPRDWATPYLEQAKADFIAAQATFGLGNTSTFCMLVQMVFEKLAKAALARQGTEPPHRHEVSAKFLLLLNRGPHGNMLRGIGSELGANVIATVCEIEKAHPAVVKEAVKNGLPQGPQLEYPWKDPITSAIKYPELDLPIARRLSDPKGRVAADLMTYARALISQFDILFPP